MITQKDVCEALGQKLGASPKWEGNVCKVETADADLEVLENGGVKMKVKDPAGAQKIAETIKKIYVELQSP